MRSIPTLHPANECDCIPAPLDLHENPDELGWWTTTIAHHPQCRTIRQAS